MSRASNARWKTRSSSSSSSGSKPSALACAFTSRIASRKPRLTSGFIAKLLKPAARSAPMKTAVSSRSRMRSASPDSSAARHCGIARLLMDAQRLAATAPMPRKFVTRYAWPSVLSWIDSARGRRMRPSARRRAYELSYAGSLAFPTCPRSDTAAHTIQRTGLTQGPESSRHKKGRTYMATEFIVTLKDRPGSLAAAAQALADGGVNLWGTAASTKAGKGTVGFVVKDKDTAKARRAQEGRSAGHGAQGDRGAFGRQARDARTGHVKAREGEDQHRVRVRARA